ncbi:MAG: DUF3135 domain-containing protein [Sulfuricella sp.]|nr:DUF3135 domain-containing protein [Sulfuricella sp.]
MKNSPKPAEIGFDFNELADLARTDPDGFTRRRLALIQGAIANAPEKNHVRLERLQFRIDAKRRLARTPMKACLQISSMMWDSFSDLRETLSPFSEQYEFQDSRKPHSNPLRIV